MAIAAKWWDKEEPINGVEASEILKDNFFKNARKLFLIYDNEIEPILVSQIQSVDIIKSNNKWQSLSDDEVMAAYLEEQLNPPTPPEPEPDPVETGLLDLMDAQAMVYEQNYMILETLTSMQEAQAANAGTESNEETQA